MAIIVKAHIRLPSCTPVRARVPEGEPVRTSGKSLKMVLTSVRRIGMSVMIVQSLTLTDRGGLLAHCSVDTAENGLSSFAYLVNLSELLATSTR